MSSKAREILSQGLQEMMRSKGGIRGGGEVTSLGERDDITGMREE